MIIAISGFSHGKIRIHVRIAFDIVFGPAIIHIRDLFVETDSFVRAVFSASRNRLVVIELDFGCVYDQVVDLA